MKEVFIDWLKTNGWYDAFVENTETLKIGVTIENMTIETTEDIYDMVSFGFIWHRSPEGHDYWNNISELWMEFVKKEGLDMK